MINRQVQLKLLTLKLQKCPDIHMKNYKCGQKPERQHIDLHNYSKDAIMS
jgi:hypothetical protein